MWPVGFIIPVLVVPTGGSAKLSSSFFGGLLLQFRQSVAVG